MSKVFAATHKIVRGNNTKGSIWVNELKLINALQFMHQFLRFETSRITNVQNSTDAEHHSRCPNIRSWYRQHQDRPNICLWYPPQKFHGAGHIVLKALEYSTRLISNCKRLCTGCEEQKHICQKSPRIYFALLWDQLTISRTWRRHRISVKSVWSDPQDC